MGWFRKKRKAVEEPSVIWKSDFSDCSTVDYLPSYSICKNQNNTMCRYVARYASKSLCSHPSHKRFISEDADSPEA